MKVHFNKWPWRLGGTPGGWALGIALLLSSGVRAQSADGGVPVAPASAPSDADASATTAQANAGVSMDDLLSDDSLFQLKEAKVTRQVTDLSHIGGSAHVVDQKTLERMEYDDPHSVLLSVPGVYVRQEDGNGLRPNIGMRGASPERSSKITLMEDGVLIAPAAYAAPAAYFFPLMTRMVGVEVWKGPSAIRFGPNTVGGAVNLISRPIPDKFAAGIDVAGGMFQYGKAHGYLGMSKDFWGFLLEGVHVQSDGFKELDGGGDTGFARSEILLSAKVESNPDKAFWQRLSTRVVYSWEDSHETYTGLSDADFRATPLRRYAGTAMDEFKWWRTDVRLKHELRYEDSFDLTTTLYRQDFSRDWRKVDGFRGNPDFASILADPEGANSIYYQILAGQRDSQSPNEALLMTLNQRNARAMGAQTLGHFQFNTGPVSHKIELGLRLHHDELDRHQTVDDYLMQRGRLVLEGAPTVLTTLNLGAATALAAHVAYDATWGGLTLSPGARLEVIHTYFDDNIVGTHTSRTDAVLLPGLGAYYALTPAFGVLGGVYEGFSPVAPGQNKAVKEEKSVNYEAGARFQTDNSHAELIGFFNNYSNLTANCTLSSGCDEAVAGTQYNGGAVHIYGLEALASHSFDLKTFRIPVKASYTFTQSSFQSSFVSENPQFGDVEKGDELPYLPKHTGAASIGVERDMWDVTVSTTYVGKAREVAGQGKPAPGDGTDAYAMVDLAAGHKVWDKGRFYFKVDNLLNTTPLASRRPYGARPTRPLFIEVGLKCEY